MCDNSCSSLVASLFSSRCVAASISSFLHAAMNLRPPSVIVPTHTSAFKRRRFPVPRYVKRRMSLCTQSDHFKNLLSTASFPPCTLKVSKHDSLWQPPTAHSDERPRPQKSSRSQRRLNASHRAISSARSYEVVRCSDLLHYAPMMRSKTRW